MIAIIRVRDNGNSYHLCDLDLMKFSEEQVRERMAERGISNDSFFICCFRDWKSDYICSLEEAYLLKKCVQGLYDGDDYIVEHMLSKNYSLTQICSGYYKFATKNELVAMQTLLPEADTQQLLEAFYKAGTWANLMRNYVDAGYLLNTPKGYYVKLGEV